MKHGIYSIRDQKAEAYLPIFQAPTDAVAERSFADLVNQSGHQFNNYPGDYTLVKVGAICDSTGIVDVVEVKTLGMGLNYLKNKPHPHQTADSEL